MFCVQIVMDLKYHPKVRIQVKSLIELKFDPTILIWLYIQIELIIPSKNL
jgi:hypothetical protein